MSLKSILKKARLVTCVARRLKRIRGFAQGVRLRRRFGSLFGAPQSPAHRSVLFDLHGVPYGRYFGNLVRFLRMRGVDVYIVPRPLVLYDMHWEKYCRGVLEGELVRFARTEPAGCVKVFRDRGRPRITPDYYSAPSGDEPARRYRVPMSQHPIMYQLGYWNEEIDAPRMPRCVFFVGNADRTSYSSIQHEGLFDVVSRPDLIEFLARRPDVVSAASHDDLDCPPEGMIAVIAESSRVRVEPASLRQTMGRFGFFLAAPGVVMPLSHNIVEAMSVGSIPVLQGGYAKLFDPPLRDGQESLVFDDLEGLAHVLERVRGMEDAAIERMRHGVRDYYRSHLTPEVVVERLLSPQVQWCQLQAERTSVAMLGRGKTKSRAR